MHKHSRVRERRTIAADQNVRLAVAIQITDRYPAGRFRCRKVHRRHKRDAGGARVVSEDRDGVIAAIRGDQVKESITINIPYGDISAEATSGEILSGTEGSCIKNSRHA